MTRYETLLRYDEFSLAHRFKLALTENPLLVLTWLFSTVFLIFFLILILLLFAPRNMLTIADDGVRILKINSLPTPSVCNLPQSPFNSYETVHYI